MEKRCIIHFLIDRSKEEKKMRVKYFSDTDTALIEFTDSDVQETKEISENIYMILMTREI